MEDSPYESMKAMEHHPVTCPDAQLSWFGKMRGLMLFAIAIGSWLFAFAGTHKSSRIIVELYSGMDFMPFTVQIWWQLLPWVAIGGLLANYWLVLRSQNRTTNTNRHF